MAKKRLKVALTERTGFVVTGELTGGPGFNFAPIIHFLEAYKEAGASSIPDSFDFVGITIPQNPGGVANIEPSDALAVIEQENLLGDLDFIPHLSCKDQNADSLISTLVGYRQRGVESILALTGDKPTGAKGVFEWGAVGLIQQMRRMSNLAYQQARPDGLDDVHQFFPGAAVSPFKYTEASQMQQYYKMENKITAGAEFLITQVGWDWKKSLELMRYLEENRIDIPVIGNVYFLTTTNPAPRLMHDIKLPGCFVSEEFLAKLQSESLEQHMVRAAQQIAMYRAMGACGVDLGGVHDFELFTKILKIAAEIGTDWEKHKDNLCWPAKDAWYLYDDIGRRVKLSKKKKTLRHHFFKGMHRAVLDPDYFGFKLNKGFLKLAGAHKHKGFGYKCVFCGEKVSKYLIFDCEECGDCFLPENFGLCTIGGCEKGLDNAPCGDSTVDGYCGNNLERVCIGELIYDAASSEKGGLEKLRRTINPPRNPALQGESSVVNYVFGYDHTGKPPLIWIGEDLHALNPVVGQVMKQLAEMGPDALHRPSRQRDYLRALVELQNDNRAAFVLVNVDALGPSADEVVEHALAYVRFVRQHSDHAAICIDSQYPPVLKAAVKEWFNTGEPVGKPLVSGLASDHVEQILPLKKEYDFAIMVPLAVSMNGQTGHAAVEKAFAAARKVFKTATGQYRFQADEVFFDIPSWPLGKDMDLEAGQAGCAYTTFETIRRIKADKEMKKAHCSVLVSSCSRGLPRKIGVNRAYVDQAMELGLDAAVVNTTDQYGAKPADAKLRKLIDVFAAIDGSAEALEQARDRMNAFCGPGKKNNETSAKKPKAGTGEQKGQVMDKGLISIGESLHASIPKYGKIMRELNEMGAGAYSNPSPQLDTIQELIESQADEGAAFLAINVDDFGDMDASLPANLVVEYVKLVRQWGKGVPVCIDSSDDEVLIAGLKEWYNTDDPVGVPMINSIKVYNADKLMPLKKDYPYVFVGLLMPEDEKTLSDDPVTDLYTLAKEIFSKAMQHGFQPDEIYFDTTVFPLAIDMPMNPGQCGYTYRTFETIKKIKTDPEMKGVHCSLGVSNCCRDLPGRKIGIARAYVQKAMEYGLDAGIVNVAHHLGEQPADPELVKLVDAFARLDGSAEPLMEAMNAMGAFCQAAKQ